MCCTEKAPNAWQRRGTQKTRNTYFVLVHVPYLMHVPYLAHACPLYGAALYFRDCHADHATVTAT